jgi:hypothetical protein
VRWGWRAFKRSRVVVWDVPSCAKEQCFEYLNLESYTCSEYREGHDEL